jgi:8-oxo-dGTP pyrophosphatase MutT (NUDIX family)
MERVGAAAVILNGDGEVLLVHHTYGMLNWELPGGIGERGESPTETAVREVREETGLVAIPTSITGWYYDPIADTLHAVVRREIKSNETGPQPDGVEVSQCQFWPPDALPRPHSDFTQLRIQDAIGTVIPTLPTVIGPRQWIL